MPMIGCEIENRGVFFDTRRIDDVVSVNAA
jgi:hypothetical protein